MASATPVRAAMAPDAVLCLDAPPGMPRASATTLYFFKNGQFACWDVVEERMLEGYPRDIAAHWPGLLEAFPASRLRGALHVPEWGSKIYFFFEGQRQAVSWDMQRHAIDATRVEIANLLPSALTTEDFTPVYAQLAGVGSVIYAFRGFDHTRWTVSASIPAAEDSGFPKRIDLAWKDGLVLAPRAGVYVDWPNRSAAHSNRKIYFFMGDLYLRWDVPSNTRNYRLDVLAGWKGWPAFA